MKVGKKRNQSLGAHYQFFLNNRPVGEPADDVGLISAWVVFIVIKQLTSNNQMLRHVVGGFLDL